MFLLLGFFTLILQLSITKASFHCTECAQSLILNTTRSINTPAPLCKLKNETSTMCVATLQIDYEHNNVSVVLDGFSHGLFNKTEGTRMITHTMHISLDTLTLKRTIQVYCFQNGSCLNDINEIYRLMEISSISRLQGKLQSKLFNSTDSSDLVCENNQNDTVPCANGFCQLIDDGHSGFTRNCIPEGFSSFSPSILIGSSMVQEFENKSAFMYICNQPMCNNLSTAEYIQNSLAEVGLLTPFNKQPIYEVETTTTTTAAVVTTTTSKNATIRVLPQIMLALQCILFLALALFI